MIFKTFQQLDSKGNVTQDWGFFGIANAKQKAFDLNELEDYIQTQESYAKRYKEVFDAEIKNGANEHTAHRTAMIDIERADDALKDMIDTEKHGTDVSKKFGDAQRKSFDTGIKGAKALSASFKAMAASMAAEMAIMLALTLAIKGFQKLNEEFHITAASKVEAMETAVNNYNEALEQSGDNISTIKGLQDEFTTLARGVNDAGENIGLSADEYERYHEIVDELVKINPELVQTYDKEGNAIIDRNTAIEEGIKLQEEYQNKATRDYINSGDDILKGARVNINDALEDARKQAGEMGEVGDLAAQTFGQAFAATLKGEAEPGAAGDILLENISNAFNGEALLGGGPNFNDVVSDYLGREVDLAKSSISTLRQVDEEFDAIIANAKAEGYSDTALQKISDQYQSFHDSLVDIDTAYQPIKDWLTAVVNEADEAGNTIASSIPEEMSAGFTAGLEQIAYEGGTADQMKTKAEELAETLQAISRGETINGIDTEVSVKLEDGTKVVTTYQKALEKAEKAKEDFDDSNRDSGAVEDYNEAVETEVKVLNTLADEWEDVDAAVAESLRSQANAINSYASENIMTLTEALNPLADKFEEARGAKERFDAAMEASGDYDTAIDSFKEVYDEIMTSENTAGNGSIALNTGAAQILGQDRVFELGSIDKIKKELKEIKPILKGGEEGTRAFFERLRECEGALNKVSDGAVTVDKTTGEISFDFDEDKWAEYARAMGISVEVLSAAVDNARQFADIDLGNLETIKSSIMDMDGSIIKKNGKEVYQSLQNFRTAALAAGYGVEEINDRVEDLKDEGVHLIDLTADAVTLAESLASLGSEYGFAQDSDKNGIYEIDAEKTITQMFAWGESVDSVRTKVTELLEAAENGDIELNFEKPNDVSWEDWIEDLKAQFDIQFGEAEDPFSKMASSADKFTDAVNNLIVALGHLPDNYEIGTNFDEIAADLDNLAKNENLSNNQKDNLTNSITAGIDSAKAEIEKYKNLLKSGDLTKDQKFTLEADIKDAEDKVKIFEAVLKDLQDGELTEFTFNAKTGNFEPVVEHVQEKTKETPTFWQTVFNADDGNVEGVTDSVLTSINEVPFNPNVEFTASIAQGFNNIVQKVKNKIQSAINFANEAMGWSSTPKKSNTPGHHTPSGGGGHLGTPQSPNYRAHSSFPSMAKGGRLGPRGNGGLTFTGELGTELVWIPSESRSFLVGQYGPEMVNLPGDAVVYPADQTRKIIGDTISPGRLRFGTGSMAKGNMQFGSMAQKGDASGSYNPNSSSGSSKNKNKNKNKNNKNNKNKKNTDKDSTEVFDWIEIAIDRIERAIERLDIKASSVFKSWSTRNKALKNEISKVRDEIELQEDGYDRYIQQANSVGLSSSWEKKVRNGKVDISTIKNEDLADKIKEYQKWYEKALDCKDAIDKLKEKEGELYQQRFDNAIAEYDGYLGIIEHEKNTIEEFMSQAEAKGYIITDTYYNGLAATEKDNYDKLIEQRNAAQAQLNKAIKDKIVVDKNGNYTQAYYDMVADIDAITESINESKTAMLEYAKSAREARWAVDDLKHAAVERVNDESDFLIDLMSNKDMYDDQGNMTNEGLATAGLHGVKRDTYLSEVKKYEAEINAIKDTLKTDSRNQDLIDRQRELEDAMRDVALAAKDEEESLKDLVQEGIDAQLDSLQKLIDKYSEALDSKKDLYDYKNTIDDHVEEISSLEKQRLAFQGDTSEEGRLKLQEIEASLKDARENLEQTEYDKYISDQKKMLDELYTQYETVLNENIDVYVNRLIEQVNSSAGSIKGTLEATASNVGTSISDTMNGIWSTEGAADKAISSLGEKLDPLTTTNSTLDSIRAGIDALVAKYASDAKKKVATAGKSSAATSGKTKEPTKKDATKKDTSKKDTTKKESTKSTWGSWFVKKKDSYPKNKLNKNTSIVDEYMSTLNTVNCGNTPITLIRYNRVGNDKCECGTS